MTRKPLNGKTMCADAFIPAKSGPLGPLLVLVLALLAGSAPGQAWGQIETVTPSPGYIHSLLIDKQTPLLGIKWGNDLMLDTPLNGEPEGAGLTLRRAQLNFRKAFNQHWSGKLALNYDTTGNFELGNNYLLYSGWKTRIVRLGVFDAPYSLNSVTGTAALTFMERSLAVEALSENKNGGLGILKRTPNSILNAAVFFISPKSQGVSQSGQALVMNYVHSPVEFSQLGSLHLGASFSYRTNVNPNVTEFKSHPEVATADVYYVDTGTIDNANKLMRFGLQAHKQQGRFSWQSELLTTAVQRTGEKRLNFWGAYTFLSWFLTNDSRNYDAGTGSFLTVTPAHPLGKDGRGAFELALRASYVDLTDKDIIGGRQSDITLGLNWYINKNFRLMTNLVKVLDVKRPGSEYDGIDPLIFSLRVQWLM